MNATSIRLSVAGVLSIAALGSLTSLTSAGAASDDHPDFAWWPTAAPSNRLYVGGLSGNIGGSDTQVYFNPKEFTIDKQVPWQRGAR